MRTVNVIEAIYFAALEKKANGERIAYLDVACKGDEALRRCVDRMLESEAKVGNFLEPAVPSLAATVDSPSDERPGIVIGPYKLLHDIGEGGMGTVWMAEQCEPVRRRVALKVIKPGMDSRQVLARFEAERQALALMDHPNIAKVLDAGATAAGRPYFVMELVKGQPITEFCDKNKLTPRERLELFVPVCHAIQHAHQKGVIHRDIKPSNVLVALYDGKPVPKVIDFGVAKATAEPLTTKTLFTRHGQVVGTFEYMSPEQATLDQVDVDTRSDVYSLGVLLYELLTGTTPLVKERLREAGLAEVLRLIREEEPPKPSTRLTSSPGLLAMAAAQRKTESQKLPRVVRGELDWIVMKALDKDRDRRFPTPNGLARDIERYLKGEEVTACPPTKAYRFRKWARKHKVAFTMKSAVAAALLVGIALASWQAVRATNAQQVAKIDRDAAVAAGKEVEDERDKTKKAFDQLTNMTAARRADQYVADMQMVPLAWGDGNPREARLMLERHIPRSDEVNLRHFEWYYLYRQTHPEAASFTLPGVQPNAIVTPAGAGPRETATFFSPDGSRAALFYSPSSRLAYGPNDERGTVKVWDVATRKLLLEYTLAEDERASGRTGSTLSRDGKVVLLSGTIFPKEPPARDPERGGPPRLPVDGWVRVLEVNSGKVLFDSRKELPGVRVAPAATLSSDGRKLVTKESGDDPNGSGSNLRGKVWDLAATDRKPVILEGENIGDLGRFGSSLSPDGSRLLSLQRADGKQKAKVLDVATGKELPGFDLPEDDRFANSYHFSPDGTLLASIHFDSSGRTKRQLKVREADNGKEVFTYDLGSQPPITPIPAVRFAPDSSRIALGVTTREDRNNPRTEWSILDARSGKVRATFETPEGSANANARVSRLFSDDGTQFILAADNLIHTFDTATGRPVHTLRGKVNQVADMVALPGGKLRTIEPDCTIRDWDLAPVEPVRTAFVELAVPAGGFGGPIAQSVVSADGAWVATINRKTTDNGPVQTVSVWDAAGKGSVELKPPARVPPGAFTGSGVLQLCADGMRVALKRIESFVPKSKKAAKIDPATIPTPDVTVWDVASRKVVFHREFPRSREGMMDANVALSPDGTTLAIVRRGGDGENRKSTVTFVDVDTGRDGKTIEVAVNIGSVSFSPDGKRLEGGINTFDNFLAGGQIAVWDVATGSRICTIEDLPPDPFEGRPALVIGRSKCWSPDGTRLAISGSGGAQIHLFDTATGKLARSLDASSRGGRIPATLRGGSLAFSPDGRRIACMVAGRFGQQGSFNQRLSINVLDTETGKEMLSLPVPAIVDIRASDAIRFTPDGHRLLHFASETENRASDPEGEPAVRKSWLRVHTWDATPREVAK